MRLAEWLVHKGLRQADLARDMGVTQPTVHNWIYNKRPPSGTHMMDIYRMSGGKVGLRDWCEAFDK
ncbi:MAG: YdaS family helix-turn-helix protein [Candidatus Puniceispirillaceae bacterium]